MQCERITSRERCNRPAVAFVMGQHICRVHEPKPQTCTHALAPSGRCAFCGQRTE